MEQEFPLLNLVIPVSKTLNVFNLTGFNTYKVITGHINSVQVCLLHHNSNEQEYKMYLETKFVQGLRLFYILR